MKVLIIVLVLLCAGDAVLTDIGLTYDYISEQNPMMHYLYFEGGVVWFYIIKIGLPLLLFPLYKRIRSKVFHMAITIVFLLYVSVFPLHLYWIFTIP